MNKESYILQLEGGQQEYKRFKGYGEIDSRLYCLGLKYMLIEIDLYIVLRKLRLFNMW